MEIILTKQCESLTGSIGRGYGYYIRGHFNPKACKWRFFGQRSKHGAPPNGHWLFIVTCAHLAQIKLHIEDIRVSAKELDIAILEAGLFAPVLSKREKKVYNAAEVIKFIERNGL